MTEDAASKILSGKMLSSEVKKKLKEEVERIRATVPTFKPGLAILQVGNRDDSNVYVGMKIKTAGELGYHAQHVKLPNTVSEKDVLSKIDELNNDPEIHGIIVQLPLDCAEKIDTATCTNAVLPSKDVDGLHEVNAGRLARGELSSCFQTCTPRGCLELIKSTGIEIKGKHAVVIGRSKIVGAPVSNLLLWEHATVTICHSRTRNLEDIVKLADIVVAACGQMELIKGSWIKDGAIVIDCGINVVPDKTKKSGRRLIGDVEYSEACKHAARITPVPGGVGPMTVAMLMQNTLESAKSRLENMQVEEKCFDGPFVP